MSAQTTASGLTPGKLWHWRVQDNFDWRYLVYTGRGALYVQIQPIDIGRVKVKARCDALTADLSLIFDGDDAKVEELVQKHKLQLIRIPFNDLDRVELWPYQEKQVRIRYRSGRKSCTAKLRFGGDIHADGFFEELRMAINPSSSITSEEMDAVRAVRGPALAAIGFAGVGLLFLTLSQVEYTGLLGTGKIVEWIGHTVGPIPIVAITILAVGGSLAVLASRLRKRPQITFWEAGPL